MASLTSSLTVKLIDEVSKPARSVAQALQDAGKQARAIAKVMAESGSTDRLNASLSKLKLGAKDIEAVSRAWKDYSTSAKLAANASDWTKAQAAGVRRWESQTIGALKAVQREQAAFAKASKSAMSGGGHGDKTGRQAAAAIAGGYAAHSVAHFGRESLHVYREFDKERRFGKAVMGISDDDQAPLVHQAIHMGATTKYNDIQVLEAQRELAARGLKKEQILGMMGAAADLGQSLDLSLPDAVKQMEGAIFGFKKNIETTSDAMASARQTADVQVRAAKLSGMTPEDIKDTYKYGATPARLSGVSEQTLLAFGGISKKANMGGNEAGTAFRALISASNAPTRGAKEAMLANGLDYANYQNKISHIELDPFVRNVAAQYGVKLNEQAKAGLQKVFNDPELLNDPAKFTPGVMDALDGALGKNDAKSLGSIAGMANRFRSASGGGADVNHLIADLMTKMGSGKGGIALANSIFGAKQGGRIANALGDPETLKHMIDTLTGHSEGYAKKIADERMSGFDGAVSRLEGATKNLETALGRAFDNDGKGGLLTNVTGMAGQFIQALAEAPPQLQRLGFEAAAAAAAFAGIKGAEALLGGFGLKGSAAALTGAAEALMVAAGKQAGGGIDVGGSKGGRKSFGRRALNVVKGAAVIGTAVQAGELGVDYFNEKVGSYPTEEAPSTIESGEDQKYKDFDRAHTSLQGLNTTVAPVVDTSSLQAALAQIQAVLAGLRAISGAASGASSAVRGINVPSIGPIQRSHFKVGGIGGGD